MSAPTEAEAKPAADALAHFSNTATKHMDDPEVGGKEGGQFISSYLAAADTLDLIEKGDLAASPEQIAFLMGARATLHAMVGYLAELA